jgi:hypothetical protein
MAAMVAGLDAAGREGRIAEVLDQDGPIVTPPSISARRRPAPRPSTSRIEPAHRGLPGRESGAPCR